MAKYFTQLFMVKTMEWFLTCFSLTYLWAFLVAQMVKTKTKTKNNCLDAGDLGLIPGLGRRPGGGHGYPLQYSNLKNPTDREAWRAIAQGVCN